MLFLWILHIIRICLVMLLNAIDDNNLLKEDGIIVVEHDTKDKFPDNIGRLVQKLEIKNMEIQL